MIFDFLASPDPPPKPLASNQSSTFVPTLRELATNHQHQHLESCESTFLVILNSHTPSMMMNACAPQNCTPRRCMSVAPTHGSCPDAWEQCPGENGSLRVSFMIYIVEKSTFSPLCVCTEGDGRPGRATRPYYLPSTCQLIGCPWGTICIW